MKRTSALKGSSGCTLGLFAFAAINNAVNPASFLASRSAPPSFSALKQLLFPWLAAIIAAVKPSSFLTVTEALRAMRVWSIWTSPENEGKKRMLPPDTSG